jgi:hypothetical protein
MYMGWFTDFPGSNMRPEPVIKKAVPTKKRSAGSPLSCFASPSDFSAPESVWTALFFLHLTFPLRQALD